MSVGIPEEIVKVVVAGVKVLANELLKGAAGEAGKASWAALTKALGWKKEDHAPAEVEAKVGEALEARPEVLDEVLAILRKQELQAEEYAELAATLLSDMTTATFVDLMRLFCVAGSPLARSANGERYEEFVDIAEQHRNEMRDQLTRAQTVLTGGAAEIFAAAESSLGWAFTRLRRGPSLDRTWTEMAEKLRIAGTRVHAFCSTVSPRYYELGQAVALEEARSAYSFAIASDPDTFVQKRFAVQSRVLHRIESTDAMGLTTVRDDIDRRLAIPYFTIDAILLGSVT